MNNYIRKIINRIGALFRGLIKWSYKFYLCDIKASDEAIDVVIPIIPKDLDIFPLCLDGIRENVANKIENIYIVGPRNERIINYCNQEKLIFVDENDVLGFSVKEVNFVTDGGVDRSGWMFQQFLKLSGNIGTCRHFVTIDSDHILINKHVFLTNEDKYVFYRSSEFNLSYYLFNNILLKKNKLPLLSYVAHKMIFDKQELEILKSFIEKSTNNKWYNGILQMIDRKVSSPFSEFELYGTFVNPNKYISVYWNEKTLLRDEINTLDNLKEKYNKYLSVTFPEYLN